MTHKNIMAASQKVRNKIIIWCSMPTSSYMWKKWKSESGSNIGTPMFSVAVNTITPILKQCKCPSINWYKKNAINI